MGPVEQVNTAEEQVNTAEEHGPYALHHSPEWWDRYLGVIILIATFGAQITFAVILTEIADPATLHALNGHSPFDRETVRLFTAISWLLFMLTLGAAILSKSLVSDARIMRYVQAEFVRGDKRYPLIGCAMSFLLDFLPLVALLFLALAVVAYVPVIGYIGVGCLCVYMSTVFIIWLYCDFYVIQDDMQDRQRRLANRGF
jgi:hypothetical protein